MQITKREFLKRLGLGGAAFGTLFSYLSFFLLHSVFLEKEQKGILNVKNCFLICVSFALVGAMMPFLFPHFWLRIILAVLYLIATAAQALPFKSLILESKKTTSYTKRCFTLCVFFQIYPFSPYFWNFK